MNMSRKRRYALRWIRYQRRCDVMSNGPELWFLGKDYGGMWDARWKVRRRKLINRGVRGLTL